ncbi:hypothetical protein CLU86_2564 [Acidovorax sp. 62]|uniref:hypothetical protein n=1 Tax=Acidovorax sp. 62 TaxID=2035203 RepID=UPI000C1849D8|nr:hypothetical protein [Acidovorax sp. 62]PIF91630.1 hypothetical protein CLU86_2564 [Acidovorax sp. 62]
MLLLKTDKARQELAPGMRTLSLRERSLLLLAEGKPQAELQAMYNGGGAQIVEHLLNQGYLAPMAPTAPAAAAPTTHPKTQPSPASAPKAVPAAATASQPTDKPTEPSDALRSLAGARMYLFDICERLFARRDPAMAQHFHSALRSARDRDSMLDVGEALLEEVAQLAGTERAQTIRERMAQLLPREASAAPA